MTSNHQPSTREKTHAAPEEDLGVPPPGMSIVGNSNPPPSTPLDPNTDPRKEKGSLLPGKCLVGTADGQFELLIVSVLTVHVPMMDDGDVAIRTFLTSPPKAALPVLSTGLGFLSA